MYVWACVCCKNALGHITKDLTIKSSEPRTSQHELRRATTAFRYLTADFSYVCVCGCCYYFEIINKMESVVMGKVCAAVYLPKHTHRRTHLPSLYWLSHSRYSSTSAPSAPSTPPATSLSPMLESA